MHLFHRLFWATDSEAGFMFYSQFRIGVSEKGHLTEEDFHVVPWPHVYRAEICSYEKQLM